MKKTFRFLGMMLLTVALGMNCASCSDGGDDEMEEHTATTKAALMGKWNYDRMDVHQSMDAELTDMAISFTEWIEFYADGTLKFYDSELQETIPAQYILDGNELTIFNIGSEQYMSYYYKITKLTEKQLVLDVEIPGILKATIYMKR